MIGSDLSYHCWYYHLHGCCCCCCCCCCDNRRYWLVVDLSFHGCCCCESLSCCGFDATPYSHYFCRWIQQATMCICLCWAMVYQRYNIYNIYWSLCPNPVRTHTRRYIEHRQWRCRSESGNFVLSLEQLIFITPIESFHQNLGRASAVATRELVPPRNHTERNQRVVLVVARARDHLCKINAVKIESVIYILLLYIYIYNKYIVCQPVYIYIVCESIDPLTLSQSVTYLFQNIRTLLWPFDRFYSSALVRRSTHTHKSLKSGCSISYIYKHHHGNVSINTGDGQA